jgi:hypothetical protein
MYHTGENKYIRLGAILGVGLHQSSCLY